MINEGDFVRLSHDFLQEEALFDTGEIRRQREMPKATEAPPTSARNAGADAVVNADRCHETEWGIVAKALDGQRYPCPA